PGHRDRRPPPGRDPLRRRPGRQRRAARPRGRDAHRAGPPRDARLPARRPARRQVRRRRRRLPGRTPDLDRGRTMITFEGAGKRYPDGTVAVDGLDLEAPTGRTTAFVGSSGSGKTTALRMVNRMVEPTSGTVSIDGQSVTEHDPALLRRSIGYVIQQAGLFPHRTVLDNVATVPLLLGWGRRKARARAGELLELVGLEAAQGRRYPHQLSGGQQQRVGVARALAADPPVLLMAEPVSAVDPVVRTGLQDELIRLQGELHKTILFVTHDIDEAVKLGDGIAVFRPGGRLAQYAPPERLLAEPADEFVERFIGYDRGVRRLSFFPASALQLRGDAVVDHGSTAGEALALAERTGEPW